MLTQGLLVGWIDNGLPWRNAPGLIALAAAAFLIPVTTGRQTYCHQLCAHGALQLTAAKRAPEVVEGLAHSPRGIAGDERESLDRETAKREVGTQPACGDAIDDSDALFDWDQTEIRAGHAESLRDVDQSGRREFG